MTALAVFDELSGPFPALMLVGGHSRRACERTGWRSRRGGGVRRGSGGCGSRRACTGRSTGGGGGGESGRAVRSAAVRNWVRFGLGLVGLAWLGLAWLGLAWLGLAWLGLAWLGLAWLDLAWLGLAWLGLTWFGLAYPWPGLPLAFLWSYLLSAETTRNRPHTTIAV